MSCHTAVHQNANELRWVLDMLRNLSHGCFHTTTVVVSPHCTTANVPHTIPTVVTRAAYFLHAHHCEDVLSQLALQCNGHPIVCVGVGGWDVRRRYQVGAEAKSLSLSFDNSRMQPKPPTIQVDLHPYDPLRYPKDQWSERDWRYPTGLLLRETGPVHSTSLTF